MQLLERVQKLETRLTVLEGWRASLKNDLDTWAKHSLEVDDKCQEIQEYLNERKAERDRHKTLLFDLKKWFVILVAGWMLMTFLDGVKIGAIEWLKSSAFGLHGR